MDEGKLVQWHISLGEDIDVGQEIAEIETSKIAGPVEAAVSGKVRRLIAEEGDVLPVGALLAVLAEDSQCDEDISAFIAKFQVEDQGDETREDSSAAKLLSVTLDDREISYSETMPHDLPPESVPVILIHGYGGDANNWLFNQGKIGETHRVIALDLPGHGHSTKTIKQGSIKGLANVVSSFLDALGIEKAHFVGHSMGAAVAVQYALNHSHRAASLTLICPALVGRILNSDYINGFMAARTRKQLKPVLQLLFSDEKLVTTELIEDVLKYKRLDGVDDALKIIAVASLTVEKSVFDANDIAALDMPISIIWGKNDKVICGTGPHIVTGENVNEYQIENAGHMPHMENSGAVNKILAQIL